MLLPPEENGIQCVKGEEHEDEARRNSHQANRRHDREHGEAVRRPMERSAVAELMSREPDLHGRQRQGHIDGGARDGGYVRLEHLPVRLVGEVVASRLAARPADLVEPGEPELAVVVALVHRRRRLQHSGYSGHPVVPLQLIWYQACAAGDGEVAWVLDQGDIRPEEAEGKLVELFILHQMVVPKILVEEIAR